MPRFMSFVLKSICIENYMTGEHRLNKMSGLRSNKIVLLTISLNSVRT